MSTARTAAPPSNTHDVDDVDDAPGGATVRGGATGGTSPPPSAPDCSRTPSDVDAADMPAPSPAYATSMAPSDGTGLFAAASYVAAAIGNEAGTVISAQ